MKKWNDTPPGYVLPNRPPMAGRLESFDRSSEQQLHLFWPLAPQPSGLAIQTQQSVEMGNPILWVRGTAVFQPFAALVLWKHYAGSRLIGSGVRKDIWIALGRPS